MYNVVCTENYVVTLNGNKTNFAFSFKNTYLEFEKKSLCQTVCLQCFISQFLFNTICFWFCWKTKNEKFIYMKLFQLKNTSKISLYICKVVYRISSHSCTYLYKLTIFIPRKSLKNCLWIGHNNQLSTKLIVSG